MLRTGPSYSRRPRARDADRNYRQPRRVHNSFQPRKFTLRRSILFDEVLRILTTSPFSSGIISKEAIPYSALASTRSWKRRKCLQPDKECKLIPLFAQQVRRCRKCCPDLWASSTLLNVRESESAKSMTLSMYRLLQSEIKFRGQYNFTTRGSCFGRLRVVYFFPPGWRVVEAGKDWGTQYRAGNSRIL